MTAPANPDSSEPEAVATAFRAIQDAIWSEVESRDPKAGREDSWDRAEGGGGISRAVENGSVFEKGGVNFSRVRGGALPSSASENRPGTAGKPFEAAGVSVVLHPVNPHAPTAHLNVRAFFVRTGSETVWWFGGGFDLTPSYGYDEDAVEWHRAARAACDRFAPGVYRRFKRGCDRYFFLPHRDECRGIGGIFFDDLNEPGFDAVFRFARSVAETFRTAYFPLVDRRSRMDFGGREIRHQRLRRGRYVEFNLLYDRGTRFGLASGGRTESILMSLPAAAEWSYGHAPDPESPEGRLAERYLRPRDWLAPGAPLESETDHP